MSMGDLKVRVIGDIANFSASMEKAASQAEKAHRKINRQMRKISRVGKQTFRSFSVPTALGFAGVIKETKDFETAMVDLSKTTGLEGKALRDYGKTVVKLAQSDLPVGIDKLTDISEAAGSVGVSGTENLLRFTDAIAKLGASTDLVGDQGAISLKRLLTTTGESNEQITGLANVLSRLEDITGGSASEIVELAKNIGQSAGMFGFASHEAAAWASAMTTAGINAEKGGTQIGALGIAMQKAIEEGGEKLQMFAQVSGMTAEQFAESFGEDASGTMISFVGGLKSLEGTGQSVSGVMADLGLKNARMLQVIPTLANNFELLTEHMGVANDELQSQTYLNEQAQKAFGTTDASLNKFRAAISGLGIAIGNSGILDFFANILEKLTLFVQKLSQTNPNVLKITALIAGLSAVLGPLLIGISGAVTGFLSFMKAISVVSVALKGLATLALAHPVIAFVSAVAAGAVVVIKNWDTVSTWFNSFFDRVSKGFEVLKFKISNVFDDVIEGIKGAFGRLVDKSKDLGKDIMRGMTDGIKSLISSPIDAISGAAEGIKNRFKSILGIQSPSRVFHQFGEWINQGLQEGIDGSADGPIGAIDSVGESIGDIWSNTLSSMSSLTKDFLSNGLKDWSGFKDSLVNLVFDMGKQIVNSWINSGVQKIFSLFSGDGEGFNLGSLFGGGESGQNALDSVVGGIKNIFDGSGSIGSIIKDGAASVWGTIKSGATAAWGGVKAGAAAAWGGVKAAGSALLGGAKSLIAAIPGWGQAALAAVAVFAGIRKIFGGARDFDQIVEEDIKKSLFGNNQATFSAAGIDGREGFDGGNTAVLSADYGIEGTGLLAQFLAEGGENGTVAYLTGAQESLDAFAKLLNETGVQARVAGGILEANLGEGTEEQFKDLWRAYADGLTEAVSSSQVAHTVLNNNILSHSNLLLEQVGVVTGKSAFAVREMLADVDTFFDEYRSSAESDTEAVYQAFARASGLSLEQTQEFFDQTGQSADDWAERFINNSRAQIHAMLDFNKMGVTAFEQFGETALRVSGEVESSMSQAAQNASTSFITAFDSLNGVLNGIDLGKIQPIQIPTIQVNTPSANDGLRHLGNYNTGGSFVVPGSGSSDRDFITGFTPGEVVTVTPKNARRNASSLQGDGSDRVDELKIQLEESNALLNQLISRVEDGTHATERSGQSMAKAINRSQTIRTSQRRKDAA